MKKIIGWVVVVFTVGLAGGTGIWLSNRHGPDAGPATAGNYVVQNRDVAPRDINPVPAATPPAVKDVPPAPAAAPPAVKDVPPVPAATPPVVKDVPPVPTAIPSAVKDVLLKDTNQINNTDVLAAVNLCKSKDGPYALGDKKIRGVAFDDIAPGSVDLTKNYAGTKLDFSATGTTGIMDHNADVVIAGDDAAVAALMLHEFQALGGGKAVWAGTECSFAFHFGQAMANKPVTVQLIASYGTPKSGLPVAVNGQEVGTWTMPNKIWTDAALFEFCIKTSATGDLNIMLRQQEVEDVNFSGPCAIVVTLGGVPLENLPKTPAAVEAAHVVPAPAGETPAPPPTEVDAAAGDIYAAPADANATSDMQIYADGFRSGWINYGWAKVNLANTSTVHSGKTSIEVACKGFDGFRIHHCSLDCRPYQALTFWINGGPTGGQTLKVGSFLNGTLQTKFIRLAPLAPNAWKQITIPLTDLGVAGVADLDAIFFDNVDGTAHPDYFLDDIKLVAAPMPAKLEIAVDAGAVLQPMEDGLFGLNNGAFETTESFNSHLPLAADADIRMFRFPGGSVSDGYHWKTGEYLVHGRKEYTDLNFDSFATGVRGINAQAFITVNYGTGTPEEAADWVKYSNVTKNFAFKYWEIGNECNLGAEPDTNTRPHDPFTYATRASQYLKQMRAVDPKIKIGIVIGGDENTGDGGYTDHSVINPRTREKHNGWDPVVLATLKSLGTIPDFVIQHRYVYLGGQEDDTSLLLASRSWKPDMEHIRQMLKDYLGDDASKVEIDVTEQNSTASAPAKQTTSLVNGLFVADDIACAAQTEMKALVWWVMSDNPQNPGNNPKLYGWRTYGGYGVMERDAASSPKFEFYPAYYVYKLMKHFGRDGDSVVTADSNYAFLAAYAVKRKDGSLSLLVINKNPTADYSAGISLKGYVPGKNATVYSYGIPQDEAARTKSGSPDVAQTTFDGAGASFSYTFPPYSATILSLSPAK